MVKFTIDGKKVEAEEGSTILREAQRLGIEIPTLCYHPALTPIGSCRLCIVEMTKGTRKSAVRRTSFRAASERARIVTSCNYPVEEGIEVKTDTEKVLRQRRLTMELLLARCPRVEIVKKLAEKMGVEKGRFKEEDNDCILCGHCVAVCEEIMGVGAIDFVNRGIDEEVDTPYQIASDVCIGCGACAFICPTGAIKIEDVAGERKIDRWHTSIPLQRCKDCGGVVGTEAQIEYLRKKIELPAEIFEICSECKRKRYARETIALSQMKT